MDTYKKYLNESKLIRSPKDDFEKRLSALDSEVEDFVMFLFNQTKKPKKTEADAYKVLYQTYAQKMKDFQRVLVEILKYKDKEQQRFGF